MALSPFVLLVFFFLLLNTHLTMYCLAYVIFIMLDTAPEMGGRKIMSIRQLAFWKWFRDYFPIRLKKTVDLDPKKNYLFGYHPHGTFKKGRGRGE